MSPRPFGSVDRAELELAADLGDTMRASPGCVGLDAPQIGVALRVFALDVSLMRRPHPNHGPVLMVDPEVLFAEGSRIERERCLSVPTTRAMSVAPPLSSSAAPLLMASCG